MQPVAVTPTDGLYDAVYGTPVDTPPTVERALERLVGSFAPYHMTGRWLDLGFGRGTLLRIADRAGWQCYGTEVSPRALIDGERRGWVVRHVVSTELLFPAAVFDVVSAIELLEHLADPDTLLAEIHRCLRPGGIFYLTTPNAASLNQRILGPRWSVVSPPDHVTLWTVSGLRRALSRAGLLVRRTRTEGCNPAEIVARVRRARSAPIDRTRAGVALSAALARRPGGQLAKTTTNAVLNFWRLGDTIKAWSVRAVSA